MTPELFYLGHASVRIKTNSGKVIYIDPYAGDDYIASANIIKAKYSIPIHFSPNGFVEEKAHEFVADKKIIIRPNDTLELV